MSYVFGVTSTTGYSSGFVASLNSNVTKLISRTRLMADQSVNDGFRMRWIDWFPYDLEAKVWRFYRLTNDYLQAKERSLQHQVSQLEDTSQVESSAKSMLINQ